MHLSIYLYNCEYLASGSGNERGGGEGAVGRVWSQGVVACSSGPEDDIGLHQLSVDVGVASDVPVG